MDIETLTIRDLKQLTGLLGKSCEPCPYNIGANYFIRTVTHHHTGILVQVTSQELVLENAAWIADDGRFQQALEKGEFDEVEMFPKGSRVIIGRGSIIDAVEVTNIPTSQK